MSRGEDEQRRRASAEELDELAERINEAERGGADAIRRAFADVPFVEETVEEGPQPDELKP
jgi:hypothetical protein